MTLRTAPSWHRDTGATRYPGPRQGTRRATPCDRLSPATRTAVARLRRTAARRARRRVGRTRSAGAVVRDLPDVHGVSGCGCRPEKATIRSVGVAVDGTATSGPNRPRGRVAGT